MTIQTFSHPNVHQVCPRCLRPSLPHPPAPTRETLSAMAVVRPHGTSETPSTRSTRNTAPVSVVDPCHPAVRQVGISTETINEQHMRARKKRVLKSTRFGDEESVRAATKRVAEASKKRLENNSQQRQSKQQQPQQQQNQPQYLHEHNNRTKTQQDQQLSRPQRSSITSHFDHERTFRASGCCPIALLLSTGRTIDTFRKHKQHEESACPPSGQITLGCL